MFIMGWMTKGTKKTRIRVAGGEGKRSGMNGGRADDGRVSGLVGGGRWGKLSRRMGLMTASQIGVGMAGYKMRHSTAPEKYSAATGQQGNRADRFVEAVVQVQLSSILRVVHLFFTTSHTASPCPPSILYE